MVADLDRSVLPIQGPPGAGKTYVSSCAILDLVRQGKRVAVASHSHKAVDNLLCAVLDRATETGKTISVAKKGGDPATGIYHGRIHHTDRNEDAQLFAASVVGGTAWLFSRVDFDASFDYTSFLKQPIMGYWELLAPVIGVVCVGSGWSSANDKNARLQLILTQALHWAAFLVVMNMILLPSVQRIFSAGATGLAVLILLALGTFTAGVHVS